MMECNNEVLAREGIDTISFFSNHNNSFSRNNEVLAREGIDTIVLALYALELYFP